MASKHAAAEAIKVRVIFVNSHLGEGHMGTVGVMLGFLLMMILDVALG